MKTPVRVAVTGAAGAIGYSTLFRIASGELLGKDTPVILHLIEITPALKALEGVVMELDDCAFPLLHSVVATDDPMIGFDGANIAILIGGRPRTKDMSRADLITANGAIFTGTGKAINAKAASDIKVCVVANPCNTNALITAANAPDVPRERFTAMTRLDENRAKTQLARKAGVGVGSVTNLGIFGNHSDTMFPNFYSTKIGGKLATEVITDHEWLQGAFVKTVATRGKAIIEARGASSAASAVPTPPSITCVTGCLAPSPATMCRWPSPPRASTAWPRAWSSRSPSPATARATTPSSRASSSTTSPARRSRPPRPS